ncbi:uncharacterized protein LOC106171614 [Lingula anatina]|uniref:Uncharacterized protein LOC106171614 n=1 Tax=Lingula anatina TaxID=7574 RepID=A0A1S3JBE2_LINAN|nr:uncharacterized protein LOC106171614 [Lingula anatina]|eukprot:XP_013407506.1 uncharacterized protein LOC106171614 [Lingula anatina]
MPQYKGCQSHEISGIVHSLGDKSSADDPDIKVGDRVVIYPFIGCRKCDVCSGGSNQLCPDAIKGTLGAQQPGGYATYVSVPEKKFAVKVPESVGMDTAAIIACSGVTTYHGVSVVKPTLEELLKLRGKTKLLVIGAGGLGLWCVQIAKAILPPDVRVISADITTSKLEIAKAAGADDVVLWDPTVDEATLVERTKEISGGGVDAVIDLVNNGITTSRALNCLNYGGILAIIGLFGGSINIQLPTFVCKTHCLRGVYVASPQHLRELVKLVAEKQLKPPPMSYYSLDQANEALMMLKDGKINGRALLKMDD